MTTPVFQQIQRELRFDSTAGVGYCSIRGAARICGVSEATLRYHFLSVDACPSKLAQLLESRGLEVSEIGSFSATGIPDLALSSIVEYYAFDAGPKNIKEVAKRAFRAFASIGIRTVIHRTVGIKRQDEPVLRLLISPEENAKNLLSVAALLHSIGVDVRDPRLAEDFRELSCRMLNLGQKVHGKMQQNNSPNILDLPDRVDRSV